MSNDSRGYYKILSLEPGSGVEEVNLAYGLLKYEGEKDGGGANKKVEEAFAVLSDPSRKAAYDAKGGNVARSAGNRMNGYLVLLLILFVFAAFVFPGFLRPAPGPFHSGDRVVRSSTGEFFGEIIRREQFHKFPQEKVAAGYLVRMPDGEERWFPASDLERHFRK